jgi:hypothetical protein
VSSYCTQGGRSSSGPLPLLRSWHSPGGGTQAWSHNISVCCLLSAVCCAAVRYQLSAVSFCHGTVQAGTHWLVSVSVCVCVCVCVGTTPSSSTMAQSRRGHAGLVTNAYTHTHTHTRSPTHTHTHTQSCIYTHTHTHRHTHSHAHIMLQGASRRSKAWEDDAEESYLESDLSSAGGAAPRY